MTTSTTTQIKLASLSPTDRLGFSPGRCKRKFLRAFPGGFGDARYLRWERNYKWNTHERWKEVLNQDKFASLLRARDYDGIATRAVQTESRTHLLFSFEKMALRDAIRSHAGARTFSTALYAYLYSSERLERRFSQWCEAVESLPRKQSRVLTWPVVTIFGFIAQPQTQIYLKPRVTRAAAREYGFNFQYRSRPSWETYANLLDFADTVKRDLRNLRPRDMIDVQSFIWVQGSTEYDHWSD